MTARDDDVGRERFAFLCRMLLIVFQRARGLDEDWTSAASNDFLAAEVGTEDIYLFWKPMRHRAVKSRRNMWSLIVRFEARLRRPPEQSGLLDH